MLYLRAKWSFLQVVSKLWTWFNDGFDELGVPGDLGDVCAPGYPGVAKYLGNAGEVRAGGAPEVLENPGLPWSRLNFKPSRLCEPLRSWGYWNP